MMKSCAICGKDIHARLGFWLVRLSQKAWQYFLTNKKQTPDHTDHPDGTVEVDICLGCSTHLHSVKEVRLVKDPPTEE